MTDARQGWNAAQRASGRPLHKRKVHGPVGPKALLQDKPDWTAAIREVGDNPDWPSNVRIGSGRGGTHPCCGYHVCSCKPVDPYARFHEVCALYPHHVPTPHGYLRKGDAWPAESPRALYFSPQDFPPDHPRLLEWMRREENERELLKLTKKLAEPPFYINIHPETFGLWNAAGTKPLTRQTFQEISDRLCAQSQPTAFQQAIDVKLKNIASAFAMYGSMLAPDKGHGPK